MNRPQELAADQDFASRIIAGQSAAQVHRELVAVRHGYSEVTTRRAASIVRGQPHSALVGVTPTLGASASRLVDAEFSNAELLFRQLCAKLPASEIEELLQQSGGHLVKLDRERGRANVDARTYKRLYQNALTTLEEVETQRDFLLSLKEAKAVTRICPTNTERGKASGVAHLIASDWHVEEKVDSAVVDGMNEFNPDIAQMRAEKFFSNGLKRIDKHRRDLSISTMVLWLLGDFITGYIHEELEEENFLSPTEASLLAEGMLIDGIKFFLSKGGFEKIVIPCCRGNHSRTTKKKRIATDYKNSFEWLLYNHLQRVFADDDRVEFVIPKSSTVYVSVYDKTIRGHHGDAFRTQGGIGGIMPPLFKWLHRANEQRHADMTFIGHWHQWIMPRGDISVNGSLIGMNAYGKEIGCKPEPPCQTLRIQSEERGFTTLEPIFCE